MKPVVTLIAIGIAMSLAVPSHADAAGGPSVMSVAPPIGAGSDRSRETLRGVVASVDERNDRITVRLAPDATADLKVNDGLLFNAVRYGDRVAVTVEDIDGAKTIVGLVKE
jgi:hypothetical protein